MINFVDHCPRHALHGVLAVCNFFLSNQIFNLLAQHEKKFSLIIRHNGPPK